MPEKEIEKLQAEKEKGGAAACAGTAQNPAP